MKILRLALSVLLATNFRVAIAQSEAVLSDQYKGCSRPDFDWATYTTRSTAGTKGMKGAFSGNHIFAAGYVRSNTDAGNNETVPSTENELSMTGPFSAVDPSGAGAATLTFDLFSYAESDGYSENAGGSFGQYDVGVAKIDATTGEPVNFFLYHGHGYDETTGLAATGDVLAISGHFTGNLTAARADGSMATIWNSVVGEGGVPDEADQFHPNAKDSSAETGVDDGFVIKASTETGAADWIVSYPVSNQGSSVVGVDVDADGNVFGSGHRCSLADGAPAKVCNGIVAMLAAADGAVVWETVLPELGTAFWIKHDDEDGSLYVTGSTTYGGTETDAKDHPHCAAGACSVLLRLSADDGSVEWIRTVPGSPRWGAFDQSGGVALAPASGGPYVYAVFDDTPGDESVASADAGTAYSGCLSPDGVYTVEQDLVQDRVATAADCPDGSEFIPRENADAMAASDVNSGVTCGDGIVTDGCVIKYHKHTGLPIWAADVPPVSGIAASPDGSAVNIAGSYSPDRLEGKMGGADMPGYLAAGGLASQGVGVFNAKISAATGEGEYVLHSGGGSKDRLRDLVGDPEGNLYNIGFSTNLVMNWGGTLKTTMVEQDVDPEDAGSVAVGTHLYVSKLMAATENMLSCLSGCEGSLDDAVLLPGYCLIDGQCYAEGEQGTMFGKSCFECNPEVFARGWSPAPSYGTTECFIEGICEDAGDVPFYQRRSWSEKFLSECRVCDPVKEAEGWSVRDGYLVEEGAAPPNDCSLMGEEQKTEETTVPDKEDETVDETMKESMPEEEEENQAEEPILEQSQKSGLGGGAVTGIIIGVIAVVLVIFGIQQKFALSKKI